MSITKDILLFAPIAAIYLGGAILMVENLEPPANSTMLRIANLGHEELKLVDASETFADAFGASAKTVFAKSVKHAGSQTDLDGVSLMCVQDSKKSAPRAFYYSYDIKTNFAGMKVYQTNMTEMSLELEDHAPLRSFCAGVLS